MIQHAVYEWRLPERPPGFVPVPICTTMLPKPARDRLMAAVSIDPHLPATLSRERTFQLERALFWVRVNYGKLFK